MPRSKIMRYAQVKQVEKTTEGSCPYCHKHVKALESHIKAKHKSQKLVSKR